MLILFYPKRAPRIYAKLVPHFFCTIGISLIAFLIGVSTFPPTRVRSPSDLRREMVAIERNEKSGHLEQIFLY